MLIIPRESSVYNFGPNEFSLENGPNCKFSPGAKNLARGFFLWFLIVWNSRPNLKSRLQSEISAENWKSRIFQFRLKFQTIGVRRYRSRSLPFLYNFVGFQLRFTSNLFHRLRLEALHVRRVPNELRTPGWVFVLVSFLEPMIFFFLGGGGPVHQPRGLLQ